MSQKRLIYIVIGWCLLKLVEYYLLPYFIVVLLWPGISFLLLIFAFVELLKAIEERKFLSRLRVAKVIVFSLLLYFTVNRWLVTHLIEKGDWQIFYHKRQEVVEQVKSRTLNPNLDGYNCQLPYQLPMVSNGGNDIQIFRQEKDSSVTVHFWIFRNFHSSPSTEFIYSDNIETRTELEELISEDPRNNWKLRENWYRICRE